MAQEIAVAGAPRARSVRTCGVPAHFDSVQGVMPVGVSISGRVWSHVWILQLGSAGIWGGAGMPLNIPRRTE